ncbi:MAG: hypothetical protein ACM30G_16125, partial [Micromonosporaceae bacterium]
MARLPHQAIEHQRRRPLGSAKSQPQISPGQADTSAAAGLVRKLAAVSATASNGNSTLDGRATSVVSAHPAGRPGASSVTAPARRTSALTSRQSSALAAPVSA